MSRAIQLFRLTWPLLLVLAISFAVTWLFVGFDIVRSSPFGPVLGYIYVPAALLSFIVCGGREATSGELWCLYTGVFVETLIIWLIVRTLWRVAASVTSS